MARTQIGSHSWLALLACMTRTLGSHGSLARTLVALKSTKNDRKCFSSSTLIFVFYFCFRADQVKTIEYKMWDFAIYETSEYYILIHQWLQFLMARILACTMARWLAYQLAGSHFRVPPLRRRKELFGGAKSVCFRRTNWVARPWNEVRFWARRSRRCSSK